MRVIISLGLIIFVVGMLIAVGGQNDWPMFRANGERTGYVDSTGDLGTYLVSWTYTLPNGVFGSPVAADLNGDGKLEIVVVLEKERDIKQDSIFVLDSEGNVLWRKSTAGGIVATPAIGDLDGDGNLDVVVATTAGEMYAFEGATGKEKWKIINPVGSYRSSPLLYDVDLDNTPEIIIGYNDGTLYSINGEAGIVEWSYSGMGEFTSSPAVGNVDSKGPLEIVIGSQDKSVYVFSGDGTLVDNISVGSPIVYSTPVISDGRIIVGAQNGKILMIEEGRVKKSFDSGGNISGSVGVISGDDKKIIFGTAVEEELHGIYQKQTKNKIFCIDFSGQMLWEVDVGGWSVFSSPALADIDRDGTIEAVIGNREGRIYVIDTQTGAVEWDYLGGTGAYASPALGDVDNDNDLEIIVGYRFSNQIRLLDSPEKPDLIVTDAYFSEKYPHNGMNLSVNVTIENIGGVAAENSSTAVYRRSPNLDLYLMNVTTKPLKAGERNNISFVWNVKLPPGPIGLYFEADAEGKINESDNTNNGLYAGFYNDLELVKYDLERDKGKAKISGVIRNNGRLNYEEVTISITTNDSIELRRRVVSVNPDSNASFSLVVDDYDDVGQDVFIVIDPENQIDELDEKNNMQRIAYKAVNKPVPDVVVDSVEEASGENKNLILLAAGLVLVLVFVKISRQRKKKGKKGKENKGKSKEKESAEPERNESAGEKETDSKPQSGKEKKPNIIYASEPKTDQKSEWASSKVESEDDVIEIGSKKREASNSELDKLNEERSTLKMEIALAKDDYKNKRINEEAYKDTLSRKQKRLDEVEAKISET